MSATLLPQHTFQKILEQERHFLIDVIMTERCNLQCIYCYQHGREGQRLNVKQGEKTLLKLLDTIDGERETIISYFGGEPLLEFDSIRHLTTIAREHWRKSGKAPEKLSFGITTNGTLLNDAIKRWLSDNPDVGVNLSLDGTPEMHNTNRSDSYHLIEPHFDFLRRYGSPIKMTIGPRSISTCAEGILHIQALGFECHATLVFEDVWGDASSKKKHLQDFARQMGRLVHHYAARPALLRTTLLPSLATKLPASGVVRNYNTHLCGMANNMTTIGADGAVYTCERAIRFHKDGSYDKHFVLDRPHLEPEQCSICELQPLCPECRAYNFEHFGNPNHKTTHHCEFVQLQLRASAHLLFADVARMKADGSIDKLDVQEKYSLDMQLETALRVERMTAPLFHALFDDAVKN